MEIILGQTYCSFPVGTDVLILPEEIRKFRHSENIMDIIAICPLYQDISRFFHILLIVVNLA